MLGQKVAIRILLGRSEHYYLINQILESYCASSLAVRSRFFIFATQLQKQHESQ